MARWLIAALLLLAGAVLVLVWGGRYEAAAAHWANQLYGSPGSQQAARALAQMEIARIRYLTREVSTVALTLAALWLLLRAPAAWFEALDPRLERWVGRTGKRARERFLVRPGDRRE
ncbi:MAG: hypothetical protein QJR14_03250 [Bacillota bacterium]|nr:hypothetical protein [Bacillota bacterium]